VKDRLITIIINVFITIVVCVVLLNVLKTEKAKIAYIDTIKLFNGFDMKVELEKKMNANELGYQATLDSIKIEINGLYQILESLEENERQDIIGRIKKAQYVLETKEKDLGQKAFNDRTMFNEQIQSQLNTYLETYGQENGFDLLLGANGQGNILYVQKKIEKTIDAIAFVNTKYNGE